MKNYKHELIASNQDLGVTLRYSIDNSSFIANHWHYHLEIIYILEGTLDFSINNIKYSLKSDDLIMINPKVIHSTISTDSNEAIVLQIPYEFLKENIPNIDSIYFEYSPYPTNDSHKENLNNLKTLLRSCYNIYNANEDGYILKAKSLLYEFLFCAYSYYAVETYNVVNNKTDKYFQRLEKITSYVANHYHEPISLNTVCDLVNLNPEYLCRFFKKYMGTTFTNYVNTIRLEHIYVELLNTDNNILDIIEKHGFYNYKQFMKLFKEVYHCTPSEKRKQVSLLKNT